MIFCRAAHHEAPSRNFHELHCAWPFLRWRL
jgi:hypothetical protein